MPLYEYECDACGHRFEKIRMYSDPPLNECPKCGGPVHKLQSAPAIQFKGTGFYITDYAKKDSGAGGSGEGRDGQSDKGEKTDKTEKAAKSDKGEKGEKGDKGEKTDKSDKGSSKESGKSESSSAANSSSSATPAAAPSTGTKAS
jgi:putative FmdB family regulatory protein